MASNIGCSFTGCNSPVIGQCSGYKGNCGQFYCRTHSFGKKCDECGRREAIDLTYQDYLETAQKMASQEPGAVSKIYLTKKFKAWQQTLEDTEKIKPGFGEFYQIYKKAQEKATGERRKKESKEMFLGLLGAIIGGVGGAARGTGVALKHAVSDSISDNMPHDYHTVQALRDIEKKL